MTDNELPEGPPEDDSFPYGLPEETLVSVWLATDWLQYLALAPQLGKKEATYAARFWLQLTDQRLLVMSPEMRRLLYELPLGAVTQVEVTAPPGREGRAWNILRRLYQVETVKIVHEAESPTTKAMFYDLAIKTRPFAEELQNRVRAAGGAV